MSCGISSTPKKSELKMWVAVDMSLGMTVGKLIIHGGHAFTGLLMSIAEADPGDRNYVPLEIMEEYLFGGGSPKISVRVNSAEELVRVANECEIAGVAHYFVRDAGRTELAPGTGTMVAFGPAYRHELPEFLRDLPRL